MLAHKLSLAESERPTRPFNERPAPPRVEPEAPARTHLMLVRAPSPTARGLAWARRQGAREIDASRLEAMMRYERLNLG
jgi:hypothetical protein